MSWSGVSTGRLWSFLLLQKNICQRVFIPTKVIEFLSNVWGTLECREKKLWTDHPDELEWPIRCPGVRVGSTNQRAASRADIFPIQFLVITFFVLTCKVCHSFTSPLPTAGLRMRWWWCLYPEMISANHSSSVLETNWNWSQSQS